MSLGSQKIKKEYQNLSSSIYMLSFFAFCEGHLINVLLCKQKTNKKLKRQNKKTLIQISKITKIKRKRSQMQKKKKKNQTKNQTKQQNQTKQK